MLRSGLLIGEWIISQYRMLDNIKNQLVIKILVKKCAKIEKKVLFFDHFFGTFLPQNMLKKNVEFRPIFTHFSLVKSRHK
jgi:hypothetical protein